MPAPLGYRADPGAQRHFRGWGGAWWGVSVGRAPSQDAPPAAAPVLAAVLVSGGGRSPREAEEGRGRKSPETQRSTRRGWSCRRGRRSAEGKGRGAAGGGRGGGRGRGACSSLETPGCAGGGCGGGGALARGNGRDKDHRSLPRAGHTPECWSGAEVEGMWETPKNRREGGSEELPSIYGRLRRSCFSQRFCARCFGSLTQLDSSRHSASQHPLTATLTFRRFSPHPPPAYHPHLFG